MNNFQNVIEALLGRDVVGPSPELMHACTRQKSVMVTGAGGSIGTELCRQLMECDPEVLILFERSEYALYAIEAELNELNGSRCSEQQVRIIPVLDSITNRQVVENVIKRYRVNTVYHAAAYKQVPMLEHNIAPGVQNNVFGTLVMARAAEKLGVENFTLISTDKAVRPLNIMGATKRFAEQILQAFNARGSRTRFSMVRFGNVLGSSGSVLPLFQKQIINGGPVTVTHPEVSRFFMTAQEAAQLVIQAGALARGGEVFMLDMKNPVKIADMAKKMIELMGYQLCDQSDGKTCNCDRGVSLTYTGLRNGEKLHEELLIGDAVTGTSHPKIMRAVEKFLDWQTLEKLLSRLEFGCNSMDKGIIRLTLNAAVEGFGDRLNQIEQVTDPFDEAARQESLATMSH